jgi:uncharacterized integral membrane protein (TIGR00697 family)
VSYTDLKTVLGVLFATSLIVANITAAKIAFFELPLVGGVAVPAGFVAIGVSFLLTDLLGEIYGKDHAQNVVNATVLGLILAWALVYVSILMPVAPFYGAHDAFVTTMGGSGIIITAGIITTLISQNIDVAVFHRLNKFTQGHHKWLRNLGSTGISQFVDTAVFIGLGFVVLPLISGGSAVPITAAVSMVVGQYAVKLVVAALDTPLFYVISGFLETESKYTRYNEVNTSD